ncbi:MAG TPA: S9 family peptidase [Gemmatimonadaceae bacterium]|jgi:dipeptidyl aminopeptidase/acylaminoacyl peptidase
MRVSRAIATFFLVAPLSLGAQGAPAASAAPRAFQPNDWHRVTQLAGAAMSPDGKRVAFTVTTSVEAENKRHSEIWVVNSVGGDPVRWTSPGYESSNPRWSEDGKLLYFSSDRPGGRGQNWAIRLDEPGGEAFQPDSMPTVGSEPKDKSFMVYTAGEDGVAGGRGGRGGRGGGGGGRGGRAGGAGTNPLMLPPAGAITKPVDQARFDGRQIVNFGYKANGVGFIVAPVRRTAVAHPQQIYVKKHDGSKPVELTNTAYSHRDAVVSPDGKWIAFTADPALRSDSVVTAEADSLSKLPFNRVRDEAPRNDADIYVIASAGGTPRKVAALDGTESDLAWSPDSKKISYISSPSRYHSSSLRLIDAAGGAPENLTKGWQYEPATYVWLPAGEIAMSAQIGGRTAMYRINTKTAAMREIIGGRRAIRGFSWDANMATVAFVATSVNRPTEVFIADAEGKNERKLTGFNDKLNAEIAWSDAERFTYPSVKGLTIEGWMMKPYGYEPGKKYPVVLYIHGGPHSQYDEGWFDEFQSLAGGGFWVLYTNPRGSSGYGSEFTNITRGEWGGDDYLDLMKAVDIAAARPDVDSTKMGVTGGSYGGFMTAWIETKTTRFKAAETDRMIANWVSWYSASDAQGLTESEFFGKPWENPAMYDTLSPIKYVAKVRTPTLLVQSEEDYRAPIVEAEQWFMSLRKQNVPAEFIRYPRSNHDLSRTGEPWLLVDRLGRIRQWFTYWLMPETRTKTAGSGQDR